MMSAPSFCRPQLYAFRKVIAVMGVMWVGAGTGCAPALNWREVVGQHPGVAASFPCKPVVHVRRVSVDGVGGALLPMSLRVCDADGQTFAMTEVDVRDPARVSVVMKNLLLTYASNVGVQAASSARQDWIVPGMTPQPDGGRWRFDGAMPTGKSVRAETGLVSRGTVIVQVTVNGSQTSPDAVKQFFEGFAFRGR